MARCPRWLFMAVAVAGLRAPLRPAAGERRIASVARMAALDQLIPSAPAAALAAPPAAPATAMAAAAAGGARLALVADRSRANRANQFIFAMKEDASDSAVPSMSAKEQRARKKLRERSKRRGFLGRFSRRLKEENLPVPEEIDLEPIVKDVDAAIASRRRRLNVKMGSALKEFREV